MVNPVSGTINVERKRETVMKKFFFVAFAAAAMLAACNKEQVEETVVPGERLTISLNVNPASKATYDEESNVFNWAENDEIGVVLKDNTIAKFVLSEGSGTRAGHFTSVDELTADQILTPGYVVYPYVAQDSFDGSELTIAFPDEYTPATPDDFRLRWKGKLTGEGNAFTADFELTGGIFKVTYEPLPEGASKVVLTASDKIADSGNTITVSLPEGAEYVYFPVPAGTYASLTVALAEEDGTVLSGTAKTMVNKEIKDGEIYKTPVISFNLYQLVTTKSDLELGEYVLAYVDGNQYKLFSFDNTMVNAVAAAESVQDVHGLSNLFANASSLYRTILHENYVTVSGEEGVATFLNVSAAKERLAAFEVTGDPADGQVTLVSPSTGYQVKANHIYVDFADNGAAKLTVAFNAPSLVTVLEGLRGKDKIKVTFKQLINFAVTEAAKEGVTFTDAQINRLETGFNHLCKLAKDVLANHNMGTLMDIDVNTYVLDVFAQYYDNALSLSESISSEKMFGWATPFGFYQADNGFTFNLSVPNKIWFDRIQASLETETDDEFIAYWAGIDKLYGTLAGQDNVFERLARRAVKEMDSSTFKMLKEIAAEGKFTTIGNIYDKYVNRFNDDLEEVYIYKKVQ